jgi:hypothetical protein
MGSPHEISNLIIEHLFGVFNMRLEENMDTLTQKECDRCGKPMKYIGWTTELKNIFRKGKKVHIIKYFNGNPDGYSYSQSCYELCTECTEKLREFLKG